MADEKKPSTENEKQNETPGSAPSPVDAINWKAFVLAFVAFIVLAFLFVTLLGGFNPVVPNPTVFATPTPAPT